MKLEESFECIHCGIIDDDSEHWKKCKKHPANKEIKELRKALEEVQKYLFDHLLKPSITETKNNARFVKSQAHWQHRKIDEILGNGNTLAEEKE